eukprot:TRINITY_DN3203_c0_g1_i4.p1 TRINITY_DN3203_c0_g1~~TRINITY_DN3203_c0_g1_i4.p1  ORF type:complete len:308 (-),score=40.83 TRINITY_DN3203_c0_g1_i4:393-1316(-)
MGLVRWILSIICGLVFVPYFVLHLFCALLCPTQDLKKKYDAQWALVTGASTGIGKALTMKLAGQGLNVVLVALDDDWLTKTFDELQQKFPSCQFRKVGVNLGSPGYMDEIVKQTQDINVQLVFANAGYLVTGFFVDNSLSKHLANYECNLTSAIAITHHFLQKLIASKKRGCFVYTSSAAAQMPGPFSVMYPTTKVALQAFGASLAAEVKVHGIDVLVFFPSPVASRFYEGQLKIDLLEFFKQFTVKPEQLPDVVFASIGKVVLRDIGLIAVIFRILPKLIDYGTLATLLSRIAHLMPDFKRYHKEK